MTDRLGAWSNAPLAYALAEVRTERLADIEDFQAELAGKLRDVYPVQRTTKTINIVSSGTQLVVEASADAAWEFATPDNHVAVILRTNGLVLHATKYEDSQNFLDQLDYAVRVLSKVVSSVYVNRLGLRYIDFVLARSGEEPEIYVHERLNPNLELSDTEKDVTGTSLSVYRMRNDAVLNVRYTRAQGSPELPPDLSQMSLEKSPPMLEDVAEDQATAVLDIDCHKPYSPVQHLDPDRDIEQFWSIRDIISEAFKIATTDHARKIWGATT